MSGTKKGKKNTEVDFETFVRESLDAIRIDVEEIKKSQTKLCEEVSSLKERVGKNDKAISGLKTLYDALKDKYDKLAGEVFINYGKIETLKEELAKKDEIITKLKEDLDKMQERCLSLERYSRDFNLRFYNVKEDPREDCIAKIQDILYEDLDLQPVIENAHRTGTSRAGKPRPIIAKFLYRPERRSVLRNKKNLKNNVWISDDLIWEDVQKKKAYKEVMKEAYQQGKKPRFHHGRLYIDGKLYEQ